MTSSTRDMILRVIRTEGSCTVKGLAEHVGISPVSVRHHIAQLQADGLIAATEVRHGVGRPHHTFSLTEEALELFPSRYFRLISRLITELKSSMSPDKVEALFSQMVTSIAEEFTEEIRHLSLDQRLNRLMDLLTKEGFDASYEKDNDQITIRLYSCPYYHLVQQHPEVDRIDQLLIAKALSLPIERVHCLLDGDSHCAYSIQLALGKS
jgi:predicted ArsR family transcriptional regulator